MPPDEILSDKKKAYGGLDARRRRDHRRALKNPFGEKHTDGKPMLSKDVASDLAPLFRDLDYLALHQPAL